MKFSTIKIKSVDVDGRQETLGIDNTSPVFHYTTKTESNCKEIRFYRVTVCTPKSVMWDSGKCEYSGNNYIRYSGEALLPKTAYGVELTIWDEEDVSSEPFYTSFETGFLGEEWSANWIEPAQEDAEEEEVLPFHELLIPNPKFWGGETRLRECKNLRRKFVVEKQVKRARLYASAHGVYNLYLNGKRQSEKRLAPENSAYQKILYYQTYDVTDALRGGENEIEVTLGDGWWIGRLGLSGESCNYGNRLGFIMQLEIYYEEGEAETIVSDSLFESSGSHIRYSDLYIGEKQDFTWQDDEWKPCTVRWKSDAPGSCYATDQLIAQPMDGVAVIGIRDAEDIFYAPNGDLIIDFGQVLAGVLCARLRGKAGRTVTFEHGEILDRDGNYMNNILGRNKDQKDVLICADGIQTFEPQFTYHGFRYVRVTGISKEDIISVEAKVLGSPIVKTGAFRCSDERLNRLQKNIEWSEKSNMLSVPTDCPQREKLGWTGDLQVFARTGAFNFDLRAFLDAWLMNMRAEQTAEGEIPVVVPNPPKQERIQRALSNGSNSSAGWGDACVLVPWYLYEAYGDLTVLEENYGMMERWMRYVQENCALRPEGYQNYTEEQKERNQYLWTKQYHFGDWLVPSLRSLPDGVERGTKETAAVVGSSFYAITADCFAKVCRELGHWEEAKKYERLTEHIRRAVREEFVSEDGCVNRSALQGLYVMILKAGVVEGELKKCVVGHLVRLIEENEECLDTGFSSVSYLLDVLCENGRKDLAYKLLFQTKAPGWLYMVENAATSIWENWVAVSQNGTPTNSSYNHYAFGCVGDWMYRHIGGICAEEPGYRKIRFEPDIDCGLSESDCSLETPYGTASLCWRKDEAGLQVSGLIPVGATATLKIKGQSFELQSGAFQMRIE